VECGSEAAALSTQQENPSDAPSLRAASAAPAFSSPLSPPDYRIWGYPYVPLIFIASCAAIVASHIYAQPLDAAIGLALVLAGLPVYYLWARKP
jgi:hypothetical protein